MSSAWSTKVLQSFSPRAGPWTPVIDKALLSLLAFAGAGIAAYAWGRLADEAAPAGGSGALTA